ncbi:tetratricopeptide repeat protein [bacterium]|nr:tetratricopeptide repeat protein [bacterium]
MINRFARGLVIISLVFIIGCGGWARKTKDFIKNPFGREEATERIVPEESKDVQSEIGKRLFLEGDMKGAEKAFKKAIDEGYAFPETHYNLGLTYYELGKYSKAIDEYQRAIQLKPGFAEAYFNMGVAYDQTGKTDKALESYKEAMRYGLDDAAVHFNMGLSLLKMSRFEESKKEHLKALEMDPSLAQAYNNLGYLAEASSDIDGAIVMYKNALGIMPDNELAKENLERLTKGEDVAVKPAAKPQKGFMSMSRFTIELDGKWGFKKDLELDNPGGEKVKLGSEYKRALARLGYNMTNWMDVFIDLGGTDMSFDGPFKIGNYQINNFEKSLGFAYGGGVNASVYHWRRMRLGFDASAEYLMGSNEDERKSGNRTQTITADWSELTLSFKTRYLGFNNLVPYAGACFSMVDGELELESFGVKERADYNEADSFGVMLGGSYYLGRHLRFQTEARFLDETSLSLSVKYRF